MPASISSELRTVQAQSRGRWWATEISAPAALALVLWSTSPAAQQLDTAVLAFGGATHCCHIGEGFNNGWVYGTDAVYVLEQSARFGVEVAATTGFGAVAVDTSTYATTRVGVPGDWVRANAGTSVQTSSADILTVSSPTLPIGTPVTLWVQLELSLGAVLGSGSGTATVGGLPPVFLRLDVNENNPSKTTGGTFIDGLTVGYQIQLDYRTQFQTASSVGRDDSDSDGIAALSWLNLAVWCNECAPPVGVSSAVVNAVASADAPAHEVFLISASGHNYAPVPEPQTWALSVAGLAAVLTLSRRRLRRLPISA